MLVGQKVCFLQTKRWAHGWADPGLIQIWADLSQNGYSICPCVSRVMILLMLHVFIEKQQRQNSEVRHTANQSSSQTEQNWFKNVST